MNLAISLKVITNIVLGILRCAQKSRNQANKCACIPRTRYCFSIDVPSKELR